MNLLQREELEKIQLPGRIIQKAAGKDGIISSNRMTMGFGHYSTVSGPMEPHQHAEEICYILNAEKSWVKFGPSITELNKKYILAPGMVLHIPEGEYHVFEYVEDGFVDLIFFYGQVDGIRPEERE